MVSQLRDLMQVSRSGRLDARRVAGKDKMKVEFPKPCGGSTCSADGQLVKQRRQEPLKAVQTLDGCLPVRNDLVSSEKRSVLRIAAHQPESNHTSDILGRNGHLKFMIQLT